MEFDEKIHTHLMSVWRESKSFFGVGGKEGMLLLTDNHFIFLKRTERMKKWWGAATKRQVVTLIQNKNTMTDKIDGYEEIDLQVDLEEVKAKHISKITFDNILEIGEEEKTWGSVLSIKAIEDGKEKKYDFSIVQDWVKYPIKDPTKYLNVDWKPCIEFIKSRQRVTK